MNNRRSWIWAGMAAGGLMIGTSGCGPSTPEPVGGAGGAEGNPGAEPVEQNPNQASAPTVSVIPFNDVAEPTPEGLPFQVPGFWQTDSGEKTVYLTLNEDQTAESKGETTGTGTWSVVGEEVHINWEDGTRDVLVLDIDSVMRYSYAADASPDDEATSSGRIQKIESLP